MAMTDVVSLEEWKKKGNAAFAEEDYARAIQHYRAGLDLALGSGRSQYVVSSDNRAIVATLFANLSAALSETKKFRDALDAPENAIRLHPSWSKAYHRKAQALVGLGFKEQARDTYSVSTLTPPRCVSTKPNARTLL